MNQPVLAPYQHLWLKRSQSPPPWNGPLVVDAVSRCRNDMLHFSKDGGDDDDDASYLLPRGIIFPRRRSTEEDLPANLRVKLTDRGSIVGATSATYVLF